MSLLMDALKKAEKDKQKAAKEPDGKPEETTEESVEESTQRLDDSAAEMDITETVETDKSEEVTERMETYEVPTTRSQFSLEPMDSPEEGPADGGITDDERSGEYDLNSLSISGSGDVSQSGEFEATMGTTIPEGGHSTTRENTMDSTMPSERALKDDLNAYFDASLSMQRPQELTDAADTLSHTVVQSGLADSSQVTAETVFVAGKQKQKQSPTTAILIIVLLLLVIAGAGLYLYTLAPQQSLLPPPRVASQIQPVPVVPVVPPEQITAAEPVQVIPDITPMPIEPATVLEEPVIEPVAELVPEEAVAAAQEVEVLEEPDALAARVPLDPMVAVVEQADVQAAPEPVKPEERPSAVAKPVKPAIPPYQAAGVSNRDVKISRSRKADATSGILHSAYLAYQSGNEDVAMAAYRGVLAKQPDNRDAILGMAALAIKSGDLETAYLSYRKLLRLNPKDSVASTALFSLQGYQNSPIVTESRLKLLLDDDPKAAHIHFSLGNLYARQSRWAAAQQAFFDAYRLDSENANYAYNLAVSLDQLQQRKAALEYYRLAYGLAQNQEVNFQASQLTSRIESLAAKVEVLP